MSRVLQALDQLTGQAIGFEAIQVVGPQLRIGRLVFQHVETITNSVWPSATIARFLPRRAARR